MRIIAGKWRGRSLTVPAGAATRPTADRVRQALFDTLVHAPWSGRASVENVAVLDVFAGTGSLGLEALSRGASSATFIEQAPDALAALRANIRHCRAEAETAVARLPPVTGAAMRPPIAPAGLVFLDPPYGQGLVDIALAGLVRCGWIAPGALIVAETGKAEPPPCDDPLDSRVHGAARVTIWRAAAG